MMTRVRLGGLAAVGALVLAAGSVMGQTPKEKPLGGPPVKTNRPADMEGQFSEGKGDRRGAMADRVPARAYIQAVNKLRGDEAPAELRLTHEQEEKINGIQEDFRKQTREAQEKMKNEGGQRPAGGDQPGRRPEGAPDRARLEQMRRFAPNAEDMQVKVWAVLTEPQQKFVQAEVQKIKEEMDKRRGEEYMQRQMEQQKGKRPGADAPAGAPPQANPPSQRPNAGQPVPPGQPAPEGRERARRIFERLQQLPPEEREQLLRRLEQELDRRLPPNRGGEPPAQRKAPPKIDDVKVPPPDRQ